MAASTISMSATGAMTETLSAMLVHDNDVSAVWVGSCWASRSASVSATSWAMTLSASGVENLMP